jgi:hypothetical protein
MNQETTASIHSAKFTQLLVASWGVYDRLHDQSFVVRPAIPILFFGDSDRYFASPLKVITVGLNPSGVEFPETDRFLRFPEARRIAENSSQRDLAHHLSALNSYFRIAPYKRWFASLEPILKGLGASFYCGANGALHTDLCSPIATAPTWSRLTKAQESLLKSDGVDLWHSLVEILAPDVIVISVAARHLGQIRFPFLDAEQDVLSIERKNPYRVWSRWLSINATKSSLLVFGTAANTPFGTVSNVDKSRIGIAIREWYHAVAR